MFRFILALLVICVVSAANPALRVENRENEHSLAAAKKPAPAKKVPTAAPTFLAWKEGDPCPALPKLEQIPEYGYVSMGSTTKAANLCESPFYFPYKCTGWFTAAQESQFKLSEPTFAVAEHYIEWQDDAAGSLYEALTRDLTSELAGNAIVKFVDAFAFKAECVVINKHRKTKPLICKKQCEEPSNWGTNQVAYFAKYARGKKIRLNFYVRSSMNSVAITTARAISSVQGFKTALTYVFNNQATDLQALSYEAALQFSPQSSEFVNILAGYPGTKPTCSFFDIICHIVGAPAPKKAMASKFKIVGSGMTDVASAGP